MDNLVGNYKFHSETNHREFLKAMGAPDPMIEHVMSKMVNEQLMIKNNGNGTWSMGKPNSDRISTFELNKEFEEEWSNIKSKSICTMEGNNLVRKTQILDSKKELTVTVTQNENGITLNQSCGNVKSTRVFHKM